MPIKTNDYYKMSKEYLRSYRFYGQAIDNLKASIYELVEELKHEPVRITMYGDRSGCGKATDLTPTEQAAVRRIDIHERIEKLQEDCAKISCHKQRIDDALNTLPEETRTMMILHFTDRMQYPAVSAKVHMSERQCQRIIKQGMLDFAFMLFGSPAKEDVAFL